MKQIYLLSLLTGLWLQASAQDVLEFPAMEEMEDTVSALSIKPLKHPKKLLSGIIGQLAADMEREAGTGKYRMESTLCANTSTPCTATCTFEADAGLLLRNVKQEPFRFSGPYELTPRDSQSVASCIETWAESRPLLNFIADRARSAGIPKAAFMKELMRIYEVTAYSITDDDGRAVYRVDFAPKKVKQVPEDNWELYTELFRGTAHFDSRSLQLVKSTVSSVLNVRNPHVWLARPTEGLLSFVPVAVSFDAESRRKCEVDYDLTDGIPTPRQIKVDTKFSKLALRRLAR